jgi:hypothetical protein
VQRQWPSSCHVVFFRDNDDDIRYGLAGRRLDQRTGEGRCRASARRMLRPRIAARSVIRPTPSRGTFLIKESNQVPKYDGTSCKSSGRTITLRSSEFLLRVTGRSRRRSSGALSFFSFLLICFSSHWFLGSMPINWMSDLREAHAILVATRSQGSVVSRHSLDRFIWNGHIVTRGISSYLSYRVGWIAYGNWGGGISAVALGDIGNAAMGTASRKVRCLALYGIHLSLLRSLKHDPGAVRSRAWWRFCRFVR